MKDFLKIYKIQLVVGAYGVAFIVFIYLVCMPIVGEIKNTANEIQEKKIMGELREARLSNIVNLNNNYNKFKDNEDNFNIIIEPNSEVELIEELEDIADQTGNKIEFKIQEAIDPKLKAKQKVADDDIKSKLKYTEYLSMLIAVEGSYDNLMEFIHKIENYKKTINIISVSSENKAVYSKIGNDDALVENRGIVNSIFEVVVYIKK